MLRYLFVAEFTDGSKLVQDQKDESKLKEGKNTYYDLLNSNKQLKSFTILEQKLWNPTKITVNVLTGIITVNGVNLYHEPIENPKYELVWYMNVTQTMAVQRDRLLQVLDEVYLPEQRIYFVGIEDKKNNFRHVIGIK